ncbi:MAG: nuclear transport factor 2 family protein [Winogradskyella sp.]|uniref:YybH family protein n=1 Tax=Winogradskyella sp. TaxID=1883156 RepID=UPI000F401287|nr:nuclear transport factor 2 family protein [Winogradskyella sp.]RNC87708.1 MAG: nuclear transport factor 2 family protein [Winogradskyella sp.]
MKKFLLIFSVSLLTYACISVRADVTNSNTIAEKTTNYNDAKSAILKVMRDQEIAWNNGDLEGFMQGYWKSDSLKFYGRNGLTKGWQNTLDNYKRGYPSKAQTGTLNFVIKDISQIEGTNYWVMGEYHLKREIGDADGVFIIVFKKINGEWKIVADMSC